MTLEVFVGGLVLVAAVGLLATAARRWATVLLPSSRRSGSESFLRAFLVATLFAVMSVAVSGSFGVLSGHVLFVLTALFHVAAHVFAPAPDPSSAVFRRSRQRLLWPLWPALGLIAIDVAVFLPASPVNWDAMTYHLYLPARWLQEGGLFHVPTVFSDNSAAFAPQNGALFFTWQMALLGSDATCNVAQVFCLAFLAVAVYRLALLLGARRQPALMAATMVFVLAPLRRWTTTANVDVFMVAFWTGALYWSLSYLVRRDRGSLLACGLATGLAAGTKTVALPLVLFPVALVLIALSRDRRLLRLGTFAALATGAGGWWYFANLWRYGNPLFPLDILGFDGVYDSQTLRQSLFRIDGISRWAEAMWSALGATTCLLAVAGFLGLAWQAATPRRRPAALGLAGFAAFWTGYVYAVVPHNNQSRFLLPALVVAMLGWSRWLEPRRWRTAVYLPGLVAALWAARPDLAWAYQLERLAASEVAMVTWLSLTALVSAAVLAAARWRRFALLGWIAAWPLLALAAQHAGQSRIAFLAEADFRVWGAAYLMFNDPAVAARRIAYSGVNVPYALMGPGWRHHAVYCNVQGRPDDGLYEFWARDPRLYPTHKPGLYRGDEDFDVWWACLERRRIDTVTLFATIPVERPAHWRLSGDFPIERDWMRQRPEIFELVLATAKAEIYRIQRE